MAPTLTAAHALQFATARLPASGLDWLKPASGPRIGISEHKMSACFLLEDMSFCQNPGYGYEVLDKVEGRMWRSQSEYTHFRGRTAQDFFKSNSSTDIIMPTKTRGLLITAATRSASSVYRESLGRMIKEAS